MKFSFKFKDYKLPTPWKIRRVADAICAAAVFSNGFAAILQSYKLAVFISTIAIISKFVSNCFIETKNDRSNT